MSQNMSSDGLEGTPSDPVALGAFANIQTIGLVILVLAPTLTQVHMNNPRNLFGVIFGWKITTSAQAAMADPNRLSLKRFGGLNKYLLGAMNFAGLLVIAFCYKSSAQSYSYDFSSPPITLTTTGVYSALWPARNGVATVQNGILSMGRSELYHTGSSALFALSPDLDLSHFEASFSLRMWNPGRAAWDQNIRELGDGVAFVIGAPASGYVIDPINNDYSEGGLKSGLAVSFDAWDVVNGAHGSIRFRVDGELIYSVPVNMWHMNPMDVLIKYDLGAGLSVAVSGGISEIINLSPSMLDKFTLSSEHRVGFTSRTGGSTGDLDIDNFSISGVTLTAAIPTAVPEPHEFAIVTSIGLLSFMGLRRCRQR